MRRSLLSWILIVGFTTVCAWGQSTAVTLSITGAGTGSGIPGEIAGHLNTGAVTVTAGNASTYIPGSVSFIGKGMNTWIFVVPSNNYADYLEFYDGNASLSDSGRSGTARLAVAEGAFNLATGTLTYNLMCTGEECYNGIGIPHADLFHLTFSASGQFSLLTSIAQRILPSIVPTPTSSQGSSQSTAGSVLNNAAQNTNTLVANPNANISQVVLSHPDASANSGKVEAFNFALPTLPVAAGFNITATCPTLPTSCWMTVPSASGTIAPFTPASAEVDASPGNLGAGVYPANVAVTVTPPAGDGAASTQNLPLTLIVPNSSAPILQLSETGIPFQAAAGVAISPPPHTITLSSTGAGILYTAAASTLSGGNWLTVTPSSGSVPASSATSPFTTVSIAANPAGLAAGAYYGRVDIAAPSAFQALQSIEVVLTVAAAGSSAPVLTTPILSPTGVIFVTPQGSNPAPQSVTVSTFATALGVTGQASADNSGSWLTVAASSTQAQAVKSMTETLSVDTTGLAAGVYTGTMSEYASGAGNGPSAAVLLVVKPSSGTCTPTQLLPVMTNLPGDFEFPAGLPVSLQAQIVDDCGNPLTFGTVQASFSSGEPAINLTPAGGGLWAGTWTPLGLTGGVASVSIAAYSTSGLTGTATVAGTLDANPATPVINAGGIVNAASLISNAPVAPGEFISIFGSNLGPTTPVVAPSYPYPATLAQTQVLLAGQPLPLEFVGAGQINAVVPYGTAVNGFQNLVVQTNGMYAPIAPLVTAPVNPAVFTQSQSGQGAAAIVVVRPDGTSFNANASNPASAGDVLEIYCSGLGPVNPPVADGAAASMTVLSHTVNAVTATVGGENAQVLFAGLAPGYVGLYQVNVVVPPGVASGSAVPVVLTNGSFPSAPVTVALQ